jgi:hypothetical protein
VEPAGSLLCTQDLSTGSYPEPDQSGSHQPILSKIILILSTYIHPGLPSGLFPSGFPNNLLYAFIILIRAICPAHIMVLDLRILNILGEEYKPWSSSLFSSVPCFQTPSVYMYVHGPPFNVTDQVPHPFRTAGKIVILYILIFKFFDSRHEDKILDRMVASITRINFLLISSWIKFLFVTILPRPPLCQSCWLQIQWSKFDSRRYQIFWEVVGLERGPLSHVSTTEELLQIKSSGSGLEIREYGRRDPSRWPRGTLSIRKSLH